MDFDFPARVERHEELPERFRGLYEAAEDGSATLLASLAERIVIGDDLTKAIDAERKTGRELRRQLAAWQALAESPDAARARIAELEAGVAEKADARAQWEKLKADMDAAHRKALDAKDAEIRSRDQAIEDYLVRAEATAAIAEARGNPKLLLPLVTGQARVVREDGRHAVRILDEAGDPRGDGRGGYLTIRGLVAELRASEDYAAAFQGSGTSGSGAPPSAGGGQGPVRSKADLKDVEAQAAFIGKHGQDAYLRLPNQ